MDLNEAMQKAWQILIEEQTQPTVSYDYVGSDWPAGMETQGWTLEIAGNMLLINERKQRPRRVYEDPKLYKFKSTNFDFL
jgi:hypothetical protein